MNEMLNKHRRTIWTSLLALALIVLLAITFAPKIQAAFLRYEVTKMTEQMRDTAMKTVCVGRFLLDVPSDAEVSYRSAFLSGWDITTDADETDEAFATRLQKKELELALMKNEKDQKSLESVAEIVQEGTHGKIFVFERKWAYWFEMEKRIESESVAIHAYFRSGAVSFDATAKFKGPKDAKEFARLVTQIEPLTANAIPHQPGFCFERGIILDPLTAAQNERVVMFVTLKGHPDVSIALNTMAGLEPPPTLLQRDAKNNVKLEHPSNFHSVGKGSRVINGIPGEEILELVSEPNGRKLQDFMWESISNENDVLLPDIVLELNSGHGEPGNPVNSSFSDAAALALWNKISSSLRLRPTKVEPPHANGQASIRPSQLRNSVG